MSKNKETIRIVNIWMRILEDLKIFSFTNIILLLQDQLILEIFSIRDYLNLNKIHSMLLLIQTKRTLQQKNYP